MSEPLRWSDADVTALRANFTEQVERAESAEAKLAGLAPALRTLVATWRREAALEARVSFCADDLDAALEAAVGALQDEQPAHQCRHGHNHATPEGARACGITNGPHVLRAALPHEEQPK